MKNNFVAKHMNTYNRNSVHKNINTSQLLDNQLALKEELDLIQQDDDSDENIKDLLNNRNFKNAYSTDT